MKVEIITLHRITNFGSLLQTYATQRYIEKLGYQTEVIDFVPEGISFKRSVWPKGGKVWKKIIKFIPLLICNMAQFHMCNTFLKKYIHLSEKRYHRYEEIENDVPQADIYLSGSDQVWNTQNNNPQNDLKAYYLCFVPERVKKIAYAGSFGRTEFSIQERTTICEWLSRYYAISTREDTGVEILKSMGLDGQHVVDPTLLLSAKEWHEFCEKKAPIQGYVFVYNLNRNKLLETIAIRVAKQKGLRIVNFADTFEFIKGAENRINNSVMDFLNYISHADIVITDSFHGTAFSLNFERQFICVAAPKYNCRLESVLRLTGLLEKRMVYSEEQAMEVAKQEIDYEIIRKRLDEARDKSKNFLKRTLEERK